MRLLALRVLPLLFAVWLGIANSQEPAPSARGGVQKPQASASKNQEAAPDDKRGTDNPPLVVKLLPPQSEKPPADGEAQKHHDYSSSEWWLVYITGLLAACTLGLMVYTARLWGATKRLAKDAKDTSDRQSAQTERSLAASEKAATAAKESADTGHRQFVAAHRPRLIVRWVYLTDDRTVEFEITNIGDVTAEIAGIHAEIAMDEPPALAPYTDKPGMTVGPIQAGESRRVSYASVATDAAGELQAELAWNAAKTKVYRETRSIYFLGYISYKDQSFGLSHRTAFCRLYHYGKRRFMPIADPDPDYEHAD